MTSKVKPFAVLIAGPTAAGKSAVALALADRLGGVVVNADSMQVYRELAVLTARPSAEDCARVPHRLYGHVPGREAYSAGRFVAEAGSEIAAARAAGKVPILVGGTGLYFKALLAGLSPIPPVPDAARAFWRSEAERLGASGLHRVLAERDPVMAARLKPTDPQRITRALEVLEATGRSLSHWQALPGLPVLTEAETVRLVVTHERDELYRRCDVRLEAMARGGALEEVAALQALQLVPDLPVMRAVGVPPLMAHVAGWMPLDAALAQAKLDTRHYVKRQLTWLRRNMIAWRWPSTQQLESEMREIVSIFRPGR